MHFALRDAIITFILLTLTLTLTLTVSDSDYLHSFPQIPRVSLEYVTLLQPGKEKPEGNEVQLG